MMKNKGLFLFTVLIIFAQFIVWNCTDDVSKNIPTSYDNDSSLLEEGWDFYAEGEYDSSLAEFQSVADRNAQATEAFIGKGWSNLRLEQYTSASTEFSVVLNLASEFNDNASIADAYGGLFLIELTSRYSVETDPEENPTPDDLLEMMLDALDMGENVLVYDPSYSTNHDPDYTYKEVREGLAQSYMYLHRFQEALGHVEAIEGSNVLDDGDFTLSSNTITLSPFPNLNGDIQLFVLSDDGDLDSLLIQSGNVVRVNNVVDSKNSVTVMNELFDYLYEDNQINVDEDFIVSTQTDTLTSYKVKHAQYGSPMESFVILCVSERGLYNIESVNELTVADSVRWWRVDNTTGDTTAATGIYWEDDPCCTFYSDTIQVDILTETSADIWAPLLAFPDEADQLPTDPDQPDTVAVTEVYNYNMINLPDKGEPGDVFTVTYQYGEYTVDYDDVDNYTGYLEYLNSKISVSSGD